MGRPLDRLDPGRERYRQVYGRGMTADNRRPPVRRPLSPWLWALFGALALLVVIGVVAGLIAALRDDGMDAKAKEACDTVAEADRGRGGLFEGAILSLKAVGLARQSDSEGLADAANATTELSDLPRDSALYENPGDYQFSKVAA